jgi:thiosulfate reductase cytochrome b subunit
MSAFAVAIGGKVRNPSATIHPGWVRVCHWINAIAILVMIGSGWQIYDASPLFNFTFPRSIALGNWLGGALLWHFAAMWVLVINGILYMTLGHRRERVAQGV